MGLNSSTRYRDEGVLEQSLELKKNIRNKSAREFDVYSLAKALQYLRLRRESLSCARARSVTTCLTVSL